MSCLHDPIIDSHSGEEVCCLCGLVINTGMSYEEIIHGDNCYDIHLENKSTPFLFELAAEFISRMHLSRFLQLICNPISKHFCNLYFVFS